MEKLEDMKIQYVRSNDEKEYAITIDRMEESDENYLACSDSYGRYIGIDLTTGEITREHLEDGIPQPYTAGSVTLESLNMLKKSLAAENRGKAMETKTEKITDLITEDRKGILYQLKRSKEDLFNCGSVTIFIDKIELWEELADKNKLDEINKYYK